MNPLAHEVSKRLVDGTLALKSALADKSRGFDLDREVAFAAAVMPRMAAVPIAVVNHSKGAWSECVTKAFLDFGGDGSGESIAHRLYIRD